MIVILSAALTLMLVRHIMLKRQIRKLSGQVKALSDGANEKILDISLIDRDLEQLAGEMNRYYAKQRYTVAGALKHEEYLKDSIANISHDLRTPLTVIMGHLQLLLKASLPEAERIRVKAALGKSRRMKELIGEFYDLSIIDSQQVQPRMERINFTNLLLDFLAENGPLLEEKGIQPEIVLPGASVFIIGDPSMLERILQNLLANAVRHTAGGVRISLYENIPEGDGRRDSHITISGRESSERDRGVVLQMDNTVNHGAELDADRMFERFYTGDRSRHGEGTGLGLAVVKLLAEKMGGKVSAKVFGERISIRISFMNDQKRND